MPAVSSPSEAIFSDWMSCVCVALSSSRDCRSSLVRLVIFSSNLRFSLFNFLERYWVNPQTKPPKTSIYNPYAHQVCHHGGAMVNLNTSGSLHFPLYRLDTLNM